MGREKGRHNVNKVSAASLFTLQGITISCKTFRYIVKHFANALSDVTVRGKTLHYIVRCYTML